MNTHKFFTLVMMTILITMLIVGCSAPAAAPTPISPTATPTPVPFTATPEPTSTPTQTPVLIPTLMPPVSQILEGATILFFDPFDELSPERWKFTDDMVKVSEGVVEIQGKSSWATDLIRSASEIEAGKGVIVLFKYMEGTLFSIGLLHGEWGTTESRLFGFTHPFPTGFLVDSWQGTSELTRGASASGNFDFRSGTWYGIVIVVDQDGKMKFVVWDSENPSKQRIFRHVFSDQWYDLDWRLWVNGDKGSVYIDDYMEISFDKIK